MKRKHIIIVMLLVFSGMFTMQGCKKDESPTPVVYKAFTVPVGSTSPAKSADGTLKFTGTTVDLVWSAETGGNADNWTVYFGTGKAPAVYKTGVTEQKLTVPVLDGQTYYWKVEAVDAHGIKTTSAVNSFTAVNGSNPKMKMSLIVTTDVATSIGLDLPADDVVDLRLLIIRKSDMSIVKVIDGGYANENFTGFADLPDAEYLVAVDIYSTIDAGDANAPVTLSMALQFSQLGIINTLLEYPGVMTNVNTCPIYRVYLANVTKVAAEYTIKSEVVNDAEQKMVGTWNGYDADPSYPSEVVAAINAGKLKFTGIGRGWMEDAVNGWGEIIISEYPIAMDINYCEGTVTIANQIIQETTYKGEVQLPYYIKGSGTLDISGAYPAMLIKYDFNQPGGAGTIAKYFGLKSFTLEISLAPSKKGINSVTPGFPILPKR